MTERIRMSEFSSASGVDEWRVLAVGACAHWRTGSFATGVRLVDEIGRLADAADHHPDIDLRYGGVTVRLVTHDASGLTRRDLALARQISAAARDLGVAADPGAVQDLTVTVDALAREQVMPFWRAVLGYDARDEDLVDPHGRWPGLRFQPMAEPRTGRNRVHVDLFVPHDVAGARIAAAIAAGGRVVDDSHAPTWWTLADPEGNEIDIATWQGRD